MADFRTALRFPRTALAVAALALGGCAATGPEAWRVAPSYRITHAGPVGAQGYAALARQYEGERRWSDALAAWQKAALAAPADAEILDGLGVAQAGQGRLDDAVATLSRAAALAPPSARRFNNLGYALMLAGRGAEARDALHRAVALEPGHALARANLRRLEPESPAVPAGPEPAAVALAKVDAAAAPPAEPTPAAPVVQTEPNAAPLPRAGTAPSPRPPVPPPSLDALRIEIANGNGVTGMAAWLGGWLQQRGLHQRVRLTNLRPFDQATTVIYYGQDFAAEARELARRMPRSVKLAPLQGGAGRSDLRVVLGRDLSDIAPCTPQCRSADGMLAAAAIPARR